MLTTYDTDADIFDTIDAGAAGSSEPDALTPRELDVLALAAEGQGNREIAAGLHLGEATVKSHLVHIYRKLGVDGRTHAVTLALQRGLIRLGAERP